MLDHDACYSLLQKRDPAYDGRFFTAVKTTRIYCRPICPARTPLSRNVVFYRTAAEAQENGFRPCLRCRPESAPDSPAWVGSLASVNRALRLIDEGALVDSNVEQLAEGLGMTGRHLRRLFEAHLGVSPLAMEQARRIHLAKTLIHETALPMTEVAYAAGFASLRRFNEAFLILFDRPPTALRRESGAKIAAAKPDTLSLRLAYRPPFDWGERLAAYSQAGLGEGERIEGEVFQAFWPTTSGNSRLSLRPGRGFTLAVELENVPVRDLARVMARVKRDFVVGVGFAPEALRPAQAAA